LLQLEDDDVFFLAGLPQLLVGHALLDQLAQEPRDFLVLELEGGLRLLQRGALPLELPCASSRAERSHSRVARASSRADLSC
jgi:hypothetical protein